MRSEILRRRCVRFGLALFEFVVRLDVDLFTTAIGAAFVAGMRYVADVVVLVLVVMRFVVFAGVKFFAVLVVRCIGVRFLIVMLRLAVTLFAFDRFGGAALADRFAGQNFGSDGRSGLRRAVAVRIAVSHGRDRNPQDFRKRH